MEDGIQNYLPTVMFRGTPCIMKLIKQKMQLLIIIKCKKVSSLKNKDKEMQSSKLLLNGKLSSEPRTFVT